MLIIGADPGLFGAISFVDGSTVIDVIDMPLHQITVNKSLKNEIDIPALQRIIFAYKRRVRHAFIERVQPMPSVQTNGEGNRATMGSTSAFNFGRAFATLYTCIACADIPYTFVMAAKWKKDLGVPRDKDGARARASQLFPRATHHWTRKKDDGRSEACLIAAWGIRNFTPEV